MKKGTKNTDVVVCKLRPDLIEVINHRLKLSDKKDRKKKKW